jgi:hypothetical protein
MSFLSTGSHFRVCSNRTAPIRTDGLWRKTPAWLAVGTQNLKRRPVAAAKAHQATQIGHRRLPTDPEMAAESAIGCSASCRDLAAVACLQSLRAHARPHSSETLVIGLLTLQQLQHGLLAGVSLC